MCPRACSPAGRLCWARAPGCWAVPVSGRELSPEAASPPGVDTPVPGAGPGASSGDGGHCLWFVGARQGFTGGRDKAGFGVTFRE